MNKRHLTAIVAIIAIAALSRLLPHAPNFTPIVALGLFGGAFLRTKGLALSVVLGAMFLSDLALGYHSTLPYVYGSLIAITLLGRLLYKRVHALPLAGLTLTSSLLFFFVTNFGVWAAQNLYPKTLSGMLLCYEAAIPFFRTALVGDVFFVTILFGGYYIVRTFVLKQAEAAA